MKKKLTLVLLSVLTTLCLAFGAVGCSNKAPETEGPENKDPEYTVTFVSDGQTYKTETVKSGEKVSRPSDPIKNGFVLIAWYDGDEAYDFDTPVTEDKTLTATWDVAKYTVSFDGDNGTPIKTETVNHGATVLKPANPTRDGYCFEGWYNGEDKYDFASAVTENVSLKAKWTAEAVVNAAFTEALSADYSNFTSASTVSEADLSYTDMFYQADNLVLWESGSTLYQDHIVVFDATGKFLALYYLDGEEWKKSGLITYADFVVALKLDEISLDDVYYSEGVYHVYSDSVDTVVYALFRSTEDYTDFYIQIEDGHICLVGGTIAGGITHEQTFYDFGETTVTLPELPAVTVEITAKNKDVEEGVAIDADELIAFLFVVKIEGTTVTVTSDMIDWDDLDLENPAEGEYTITVSFETWDGVTHTETATVTVKTDEGEETFATIFAKDYTNVSATQGTTVFKRMGNWWTSSAVNVNNTLTYYYMESDNTITKFAYNTSTEAVTTTANNWFVLPRLEMLFALDVTLFEQQSDTNTYVAKNVDAVATLLDKTTMLVGNVIDTKKDYSITLTVELGRVVGITYNYFYKGSATATTSSARSLSYTLSDFGTTEIDIVDAVKALRPESAALQAAETAYVEDRKFTI